MIEALRFFHFLLKLIVIENSNW